VRVAKLPHLLIQISSFALTLLDLFCRLKKIRARWRLCRKKRRKEEVGEREEREGEKEER